MKGEPGEESGALVGGLGGCVFLAIPGFRTTMKASGRGDVTVFVISPLYSGNEVSCLYHAQVIILIVSIFNPHSKRRRTEMKTAASHGIKREGSLQHRKK